MKNSGLLPTRGARCCQKKKSTIPEFSTIFSKKIVVLARISTRRDPLWKEMGVKNEKRKSAEKEYKKQKVGMLQRNSARAICLPELRYLSTNYVIFWDCLRNSEKNSSKFGRKMTKLTGKKREKIKNEISFFIIAKSLTLFCWNFEVWAVQRNVNLVDLENPCKMSLWSLS